MEFRIQIEKIETVPQTQREWKIICDTGNEHDGGPKYGYATYETTVTKSTKIYEQTIVAIDLGAIIQAVNKEK